MRNLLKGVSVFNPFAPKNTSTTTLDELIDAANTRLFGLEAGTEEYNKVLIDIERLQKLKSKNPDNSRVSPDTLVLVLGNLAGILLILNYERIGIVTSKAMSFVLKAR